MFYQFRQNNSGGSFVENNKVAHFVIIEAEDHVQANEIAESIGIYFDGCEKELDCDCCGDRWSEVEEGEGDETPVLYGEPINKYDDWFCNKGDVYCYLYKLDGEVVTYRKGESDETQE
jgi:hypothetical protein